uniref:Uncharacterized protein n=1 Tax=Leersia perrieri TaxID=77586 RepID=A0A0D9V447_9ORYZ
MLELLLVGCSSVVLLLHGANLFLRALFSRDAVARPIRQQQPGLARTVTDFHRRDDISSFPHELNRWTAACSNVAVATSRGASCVLARWPATDKTGFTKLQAESIGNPPLQSSRRNLRFDQLEKRSNIVLPVETPFCSVTYPFAGPTEDSRSNFIKGGNKNVQRRRLTSKVIAFSASSQLD